jgi:hypothetical protein
MNEFLKDFIEKRQFSYKPHPKFFIVQKINILIFLLLIYLFTQNPKNTFENFLITVLFLYLYFSYKTKRYETFDYISGKKNDNLFYSFILKVKKYVYKKNN